MQVTYGMEKRRITEGSRKSNADAELTFPRATIAFRDIFLGNFFFGVELYNDTGLFVIESVLIQHSQHSGNICHYSATANDIILMKFSWLKYWLMYPIWGRITTYSM